MLNKLSLRMINFLAMLSVVGLLAFAIYLQNVKGLIPCPLCMVQRYAFYAMAILFFIGIFLPSTKWPLRIQSILLVLCAGVGLVAAGRQIWLIHFASYIPPCGADFYYMLHNLPFGQFIFELINGQGDCAKEEWFLFGVGIVTWSTLGLLFFFILGCLMPWLPKYLPANRVS